MKLLILTLLLVPGLVFGAYTEFYTQSGGSNLNACSTTSNSAAYTSTNGAWSTVTNVFTPTDGSTPSSTVSVGDFASVYVDGASVGVYIGRVTVVGAGVNGAITIPTANAAGAIPTTSANGRSIKVGGACKGPNAAQTFPVNLSNISNLKNTSGDIPRINLKNDATYSITAALSSAGGPLCIQGYTGSPGDLGKAIIDGGTSLISILQTASNTEVYDIEVTSSATSGTTDGFRVGANNIIARCIAHGVRASGFTSTGTESIFVEDEAYSCGKANSSGDAGFNPSSFCVLYYCYSHDNTGSNIDGFYGADSAPIAYHFCIADSNGRDGFSFGSSGGHSLALFQSNSYNNGRNGLYNRNTTTNHYGIIRNCDFIKNAGWGFNTALTTGHFWGLMDNCGFGSGTQANTLGTTNNTAELRINGSITYESGVTPYVAPTTGNFTLTNTSTVLGLGTGRGSFTETDGTNTGTISYPDIGAAQHNDTAGGVGCPTPSPTPTATATFTPTPTATATATATSTATPTATATSTPTPTITPTATPVEISYGFSGG